MPSSYTTSLRLTLPATGELAGQWGNTVNTGITELLDAAVAGTTTISTWGGAGVAYTLSNNSGTADEARRMFIVATGTPGEAKNVICPAVSKFYVFRNDTTGGFALTLKTSGGTGIAVPAGQYKFLYCDGTNVVEMFNSAGALTLSGALTVGGTATFAANPTLSAGTANQVQFLNASKVLTGSANMTFNGTDLTVSGAVNAGSVNATTLDLTNLEVTNIKAKDGTASASIADSTGVMSLVANPVLSGGTANGVLYLDGSKVATSGSALTFDGTALTVGTNGLYLSGNTGGAAYMSTSAAGAATELILGTSGNIPIRFIQNNSEQMRLTSTGLGIGTSSPGVKLDIAAATAIARLTSTTGTNVGYYQVSNTGGGLYIGRDSFAGGGFYSGSPVYGAIFLSTGAYPMAFAVDSVERMRLDSSGNLGIGTSSPATKLDVRAAAGSGGLITLVNTTAFANTNVIETSYTLNNSFSGLATAAVIGVTNPAATGNSYGDIYFKTTNPSSGLVERMRLDSSGNLGLGVTPSAWGTFKAFDLFSSLGASLASTGGSMQLGMNFYYDGSNYKYKDTGYATRYEQLGGGAGTTSHAWYTAPSGTAGNAISFTQAMTLDASGRWLLGTTTGVGNDFTSIRFNSGGTYSQGLNMVDSNASASGTVFQVFRKSDDTYLGNIRRNSTDNALYVGGNSYLALGSGDTERARITSGGDLGIGTTSPDAKLDVAGIQLVGLFGSESADNAYIGIKYNSTILGYVGNGSGVSGGSAATEFSIGSTGARALTFGTNDLERARITSGGDVCVNTTAAVLSAKFSVETAGGRGYGFNDTSGTAGTKACIFGSSGVEVGSISTTTTATSYNTSSDYRLKDNPQPLTGSGAFIDALQPKTWEWKTDGTRGVGFIAHEAQAVSPSSVVGTKDAVDEDGKPVMQAMEYGSAEFIANIIAELQSLRARVAALEAQP